MLPPRQPAQKAQDPIGWMALIWLAFAALTLAGIGEVGIPIFDEIHYLPAARAWIAGEHLLNPEHPVLGKQLIALSIMAFGDNPFGWRAVSWLAALLTLWALMRMTWLASESRFAALTAGVLVASNFLLVVQARIATLDTTMLAFLMLGCWALIAAWRGRWARARVALAGVLFGLALAVKWNPAPVIAFAGLATAWVIVRHRKACPFGGMGVVEAAMWLGALPLAIYFASFETIRLLETVPGKFTGPIDWQLYMFELQESVTREHGYMSRWWQWVLNWRPIWYFYEEYEGAWRGMLLLGNPLSMWSGLVALPLCLWLGIWRGRGDCLLAVGGWAAALAMWIFAPKPVQFYYHYLISAQFLCIALALALDAILWRRSPARVRRGTAIAFLGASLLLAAYFHPILTTMKLASKISFADYAWFESWR